MQNQNVYVFDIETDGLYDDVTKIHCLSYFKFGSSEVKSITDTERIKKFFQQENLVLIGHNIICYDMPTAIKVLGIEIKPKRVIDTLGISWYLNSSKDSSFKHGLEHYGERYGVPKPKIDNWESLTVEEYVHRCEEDVKINTILWRDQQAQLKFLYEDNWNEVLRLLDYITFKLDVVAEQQDNRTLLDINLIHYEINRLSVIAEERRNELLKAMPQQEVKATKVIPKVLYKQDGSLSLNGEKWFKFLEEQGLPLDTQGGVNYVKDYEEPNPDSISQIKDWLFSLGWKPKHFKFIRNKETNESRQVPQIVSERDNTELCESVLELSEEVPELKALAGYSTVKHRIKIFEGFLRDKDKENRLQWDSGGFTNTFRLKHRKVVNLPKPSAPYAENIRACFIADEGEYLVGSDLSGIEDATKRHYIKPLDPEYVASMEHPDFDAHIEIAVRAGLLTQEQADLHIKGEANYKEERSKAKTVNFCVPVDNTEVLTTSGWKYYKDLSIGENILSYKDGELVVTDIKELPYFKDSSVGVLGNKEWRFECTENHRWLVRRCKYELGKRIGYEEIMVETKDLKYEDLIVNSAKYNNKSTLSVEDCRVLGWVLSDGHLKFSEKSDRTSSKAGSKKGVLCSVAQKKYVEILRRDLIKSKIDFVEDSPRKDGVIVFRIKAESVRLWLTRLGLPFKSKHDVDYTKFILGCGYECREAFLKTFHLADGGVKSNPRGGVLKTKLYYQNTGNINDAVQLAITLNGGKYTQSFQDTYSGNSLCTTRVNSRNYTTMQRLSFKENRKSDVFCCNNDNGTFIIRQNGLVSITGNSATYGVGAPTLARNMKTSEKEAKKILEAYWERNWAVKTFAESCKTKMIGDQMWVQQPVSKFWYTLRTKKDIFSTVNQGTAVYVFDRWCYYLRKLSIRLSAQMHDELVSRIKFNKLKQEEVISIFKDAMKNLNDELKLNVEIKYSIDFGRTYLDIH